MSYVQIQRCKVFLYQAKDALAGMDKGRKHVRMSATKIVAALSNRPNVPKHRSGEYNSASLQSGRKIALIMNRIIKHGTIAETELSSADLVSLEYIKVKRILEVLDKTHPIEDGWTRHSEFQVTGTDAVGKIDIMLERGTHLFVVEVKSTLHREAYHNGSYKAKPACTKNDGASSFQRNQWQLGVYIALLRDKFGDTRTVDGMIIVCGGNDHRSIFTQTYAYDETSGSGLNAVSEKEAFAVCAAAVKTLQRERPSDKMLNDLIPKTIRIRRVMRLFSESTCTPTTCFLDETGLLHGVEVFSGRLNQNADKFRRIIKTKGVFTDTLVHFV
jgi:hypothetical protein